MITSRERDYDEGKDDGDVYTKNLSGIHET
jgi:hypothetical protein